MRKYFIKLLIVFFVLNSCKSTEKTNKTNGLPNNSKLIKSLQVKYDVFVKPRQLVLHQNGILINQGEISLFRWAYGPKKVNTVRENNIIDGWVQDELGGTIIKDFKGDTFIHRQIFIAQPYIYKERIPKFDWKIDNTKKRKINNFSCNYAETYFRGRKYIAWFTPEIPIMDGPWKFYGLPGLILEIYDTGNLYVYKASEVNYPVFLSKIDTTLTGERVDKMSFYNAYKNEWMKIKKKSMAQSDVGDGKIEIKMIEYHPQEIISNKK